MNLCPLCHQPHEENTPCRCWEKLLEEQAKTSDTSSPEDCFVQPKDEFSSQPLESPALSEMSTAENENSSSSSQDFQETKNQEDFSRKSSTEEVSSLSTPLSSTTPVDTEKFLGAKESSPPIKTTKLSSPSSRGNQSPSAFDHWLEIKALLHRGAQVLQGKLTLGAPIALSMGTSWILLMVNFLLLLVMFLLFHRSFLKLLGTRFPPSRQVFLLPLALLLIHGLVQGGFAALFAHSPKEQRHNPPLTFQRLLSLISAGTLYWSGFYLLFGVLLWALRPGSLLLFLGFFGLLITIAYSLLLLYQELEPFVVSSRRRVVASIVIISVQMALSSTALLSQGLEMFHKVLEMFFS